MIRITQSYLTNSLCDKLQKEGWNILYADYSDGRRGGEGNQGVLNKCFETLFDEFPDIVAQKDEELLIVEVDLRFKQNYEDKLRRFSKRKDELVQCIEQSLSLKTSQLKTGMAFEKKPTNPISDMMIWEYDNTKKQFEIIKN